MKTSFLLPLLLLGLFCTDAAAQSFPRDVEIVRDRWGVPHIFGKTDADAAYGLAWATCEDDFETVQRLLLAVRSRLGEVDGKDGAMLDMMGRIAQVDEVVDRLWDGAFSDHYLEYVKAYSDGLNRYAELHPKQLLRKKLFPVNEKDIIKSYTLTLVFLTNVYVEIQQIFSRAILLHERNLRYRGNLPDGSNAFAFNGNITENGHTYLAINSHQPLEGLFSWYEAHLVSEEGLNILGGTFPGGCSIFHGVNEYLGWAATLNHPDLADVYKLEMHPKKKLQYRYDDGYETLEVVKAKVKVKVGPIRLPITKKFYKSKYGITIKNKDGFYSLRFPANQDIRSPEQLYMMNKAKSFEEFKELLNMGHFPGTNMIYADREGNIFYISNGQFPYRDPSYDWKEVLPGNTSATLWEPEWHPVSELPQYENPEAGYLFNTNGTPFFATAPEENLRAADFDATFGYQTKDMVNNRAIMADSLIRAAGSVSWEDFKRIKYDRSYNQEMLGYNINNMWMLDSIDPEKYPKLKESFEVIRDWDHVADVEDEEAALLIFTFNILADIIMSKGVHYEVNSLSEKQYIDALREATKHMKRHFGSLRVPLGEVQKHVRGDKELPIGGAPDVLAANMSKPHKKGKLKTFVGDSYIILVDFDKDGPRIESVNAFGASNVPESPHYDDQMELFVEQKTKSMTLDREKIYEQAERVYRPE